MVKKISDWLDGILQQPIPGNAEAFCFNLYEDGDADWSMELIVTERFDAEDYDWACDEITDFGTREEPFAWSCDAGWEKILEETVLCLKEYLENGKYAGVLKSRKGIGVGFVDGDIKIIYKRGN